MTTLDLNGSWEFKAVDAYSMLPPEHQRVMQWMPATVPGTVHTDLMENKVVPDPFFGTNENDVQWVEGIQWLYRRSFNLPASLRDNESVQLRADGLDTYALIRVNGKEVGRTSNMFVGHSLDLKAVLRAGENSIEILFDSPAVRSKQMARKHGQLRVALQPHRVYVRKAQYSFSWDWGPKLTTSGIWRPIAIEASSHGYLSDPFVKVASLSARQSVVTVSAELKGRLRAGSKLCLVVEGGEWKTEQTVAARGAKATIRIRIPNPRLWWPNGHGEQSMYTAHLSLLHGDETVHKLHVPFALRTVRLLQETDAEGKSFIVVVNGRKIFCKGADWIPADSFLPRIPASRYEVLLRMGRDANMNMIRVWGGGIYESDTFYDLCDRLGLMVWQDFMFACGEYPQDERFLKGVRAESEQAIKRLRNHPSIVLWCGNNECEWLFCVENPGKHPDEMTGARIFRDLLPQACKDHDGTRPYWRSSPFGSGFPNDESNGNHHQWLVWSFWKDFREYEKDNARFVTEFGFQAPANVKTMESCTAPEDRHPQSRVVEHHNKQVGGPERLMRFMAAHYRLETDFARFTYLAQLVQAEALKCAVEHWRRRKYRTAGAIFWQLNDCWPAASWAVIDSALRPKAAYFYAKRFFAPVLVSFREVAAGIGTWVTNDRPSPFQGVLTVSRQSFDGKVQWTEEVSVHVPADSSRRLALVNRERLASLRPESEYLLAVLKIDGEVEAESRHFFTEPKFMLLPDPGLKAEIREEENGLFVVSTYAVNFVKNLRLEISGEDAAFEDNYVDIDAGASKHIRFRSSTSLKELSDRLRVEWLH
jgi:beta-mannosidase